MSLLFSHMSCPTLSNPKDCIHQPPLSMGFPRQEYWSGLSFPSARDLPGSEIEHMSPALVGGFFTTAHQGSPTLCQLPQTGIEIFQDKLN